MRAPCRLYGRSRYGRHGIWMQFALITYRINLIGCCIPLHPAHFCLRCTWRVGGWGRAATESVCYACCADGRQELQATTQSRPSICFHSINFAAVTVPGAFGSAERAALLVQARLHSADRSQKRVTDCQLHDCSEQVGLRGTSESNIIRLGILARCREEHSVCEADSRPVQGDRAHRWRPAAGEQRVCCWAGKGCETFQGLWSQQGTVDVQLEVRYRLFFGRRTRQTASACR